jgi:hypothetical protein
MTEATPDWFQTPPLRRPDPEALLTVHAIRRELAELAALQAADYRAYGREQRIRAICEREWDSPAARRVAEPILKILDERKSE